MTRIKLQCEIERLPAFCALYRCAFRSGHGGRTGPLKQAFYRLAYYGMDALGVGASTIRASIRVRGRARTVGLNGRNRQFNSLYFAKYALSYEPEVALALDDFCGDDDVFLDVGSNWGYFSILVAARESFRGTVHAFEPSPDSFGDLSRLVRDLDLADCVSCHEVALGAESAELSMSAPRHSGLAKVNREGIGRKAAVVPLDSFDLSRVDLVKMDVEGFEHDVIKGGQATISRCRPVIIFESNTRDEGSHAVLSALAELSYGLFVPRIGIEDHAGRVITVQPSDLEADKLGQYRNYYDPLLPESRHDHADYMNIVAVPEERRHAQPRVRLMPPPPAPLPRAPAQ